jgi:hypothetical protein
MIRLRTLLSRLAEFVFWQSRETRLDAEIEQHIEMLTDSLIARGVSPDQARLEARRQFGNVDALRMTHRDQRGFASVESLSQDLRFAVRILTRDRGFAIAAIVVLGVGLGVNNMFFTLVYAHKYRGLPITRADRVLAISVIDDRARDRPLTLAEFETLAHEQSTFASLAAYMPSVGTLGDEARAAAR